MIPQSQLTYKSLPVRGITQETCEFFDYAATEEWQVATYRDAQGNPVGQKLRDRDKNFSCRGDMSKAVLYGRHKFKPGQSKFNRVVVVEGEIDCLSLYQSLGSKKFTAVVSLPQGANSAEKTFRQNLDWLEQFDEVVILFDNDKAGKEEAPKAAQVLTPGRAFIQTYPEGFKDANEMLVAGETAALAKLEWNAKPYKPDGIVTIADIREKVYQQPDWGRSYPIHSLTQLTYGMRPGELVAIGAGTGTGKTTLMKSIAAHLVTEHNQTVGLLMLEEAVQDTAKGLMTAFSGKPFHLPDSEYTQEEFDEAYEKLAKDGRVQLYDCYGVVDWETVKARIRYMAVALGCRWIFLDHITMMVYSEQDERKALDKICGELTTLVQELKINVHFVSHLATPEGKPHEEGGRVMLRHLRGSRAIAQCCSFAIGLERDQQKPDEPMTVRILKDRYAGKATGRTFQVKYDHDKARMVEVEVEFDASETLEAGGTSSF